MKMKLSSYAKINLTLDILGKRKDSYHEIRTVYQTISLYDDIIFKKTKEKITIESSLKELENDTNLAFKAAKLIKERYKIKNGVSISIKKRIPIGAGLSGGSSNAAAVLKGLDKLWNLRLNKEQLIALSRELGMDVAFHILGGTCLGKGRGEILKKIKDFPKHYVVVVYPGFMISTREAYSSIDLKRIGKKRSTEKFIKNYDLNEMHNDFEYSIFRKYPELKKIKEELGTYALLSGSGSSVFGLFNNEKDAQEVYNKLKKKYKNVFLTTTVNKSQIF